MTQGEELMENRMNTELRLEGFVHNLIDRLLKSLKVEDAIVEIKRDWPRDYPRAARRLGGHCNAAKGQSILWIIGVDENGRVTPAQGPEPEPHQWLAQIKKWFDGLAPDLICDRKIPRDEGHVTALMFDTRRAPYVVRNPERDHRKGEVDLEVPWREATEVRSARRQDLVRMFQPFVALPSWELIEGALAFGAHMSDQFQAGWHGTLTLYAVPRSGGNVVIPFHKLHAAVRDERQGWSVPLKVSCPPSFGRAEMVGSTNVTLGEIILYGPAKVELQLSSDQITEFRDVGTLQLDIDYVLAGDSTQRRIGVALVPIPQADLVTSWRAMNLIE